MNRHCGNHNNRNDSQSAGQANFGPSGFRRYLMGGRLSLITLAEALTVAETLSFRKAAPSLGVMPSAVSTRISALEEALGYRLFDRQRGVRLTVRGHVFLDFAARALDLIAQGAAMREDGLRAGVLRIALQSSTTSGPQATLIEQFRRSRPDVLLIPEEMPPRDLAGSLRRRTLDIALTPWTAYGGDFLQSRPLWHENMIVALSKEDPLAERDFLTRLDLSGRTFLMRTEGIGPSLMELALPWLTEGTFAPKIEEMHAGRDALLLAVTRNRVLALAMPAARDLHTPGIVFRELRDIPHIVTFCSIWSRYNTNPALRAFLKTVTSVFGPDDPSTSKGEP